MLVMLGLLLGPVYYIFCEYLSGQDGETLVLRERAGRWTLPDGTILHVSHGIAFRPATLQLTPEMQHVGFRLTFEGAAASSEKSSNEYQLTVLQSDQPIFERTLQVDLPAGGQRSVETGGLTVYYPGAYSVLLQEVGTPSVPAAQVTVTVRTKIETALVPLLWAGAAMLVVGIAISLEPYLARSRMR